MKMKSLLSKQKLFLLKKSYESNVFQIARFIEWLEEEDDSDDDDDDSD